MYMLGLICVFAETILEIVVLLGIIVIPFFVLGITWELVKYYISKHNRKHCR